MTVVEQFTSSTLNERGAQMKQGQETLRYLPDPDKFKERNENGGLNIVVYGVSLVYAMNMLAGVLNNEGVNIGNIILMDKDSTKLNDFKLCLDEIARINGKKTTVRAIIVSSSKDERRLQFEEVFSDADSVLYCAGVPGVSGAKKTLAISEEVFDAPLLSSHMDMYDVPGLVKAVGEGGVEKEVAEAINIFAPEWTHISVGLNPLPFGVEVMTKVAKRRTTGECHGSKMMMREYLNNGVARENLVGIRNVGINHLTTPVSIIQENGCKEVITEIVQHYKNDNRDPVIRKRLDTSGVLGLSGAHTWEYDPEITQPETPLLTLKESGVDINQLWSTVASEAEARCAEWTTLHQNPLDYAREKSRFNPREGFWEQTMCAAVGHQVEDVEAEHHPHFNVYDPSPTGKFILGLPGVVEVPTNNQRTDLASGFIFTDVQIQFLRQHNKRQSQIALGIINDDLDPILCAIKEHPSLCNIKPKIRKKFAEKILKANAELLNPQLRHRILKRFY